MSQLPKILLCAATLASTLVGCAPVGTDDDPDSNARTKHDWGADYPPIDPASKYMKPGPVLATGDAQALAERLGYHQAVIDAYGFSYQIGDLDTTHFELASLTGLVIPDDAGAEKPKPLPQADMILPEKWDTRANGAGLPAIRNQGGCGSCWAFGTVAATEASIAVSTGQIVDLSEQMILDCNGYGYSCGGGFWAYEKLLNPGGAPESEYKYTAYDGSCRSNQVSHPYKIESYHGVPDHNIDAIKQAIFQYGAVGVTMAVCGSIPGYHGGIYDSTECNWAQSNHIVALVGWDDTVAHHQGKGVWIMRNSWGTSWGESGYARMAYGSAGLEENGTYVIYKPEDPTDTDGDGVRDVHDNCKLDANTNQLDADQDGKGDACDATFEPFEKALTLSDDDSRKVDLGFSFPFYGTTYSSVYVNADGNLTFGSSDDKSEDRSKARFLTLAPRIAALYADLNPAGGGKVVFGKQGPDSFYVRWDAVPLYKQTGGNTVTVALDPSGAITVTMGTVKGSAFIVGVSRGGAGNAANESDLSASASLPYGGTNAVFEVYGSGKTFDLAGKTFSFTTDGAGPGPGPAPASETTLALGDDDSAKVALGFSFPFFGKTYTDVYVNADGNLTFGAGDSATETRSATRFLTGAPRIAALYADLDPSAGGVVSHRKDTSDSLTITYKGVRLWGKSTTQTAIVTLTADGLVTVSYESVGGSSFVVGVSQGGAGNSASETDLSAYGGVIPFGGTTAVYQVFGSGKTFDLSGKTVTFSTETSDDPAPPPAPADIGLSLGDDASALVNLGFSFPFYGKSYTSVYVNSDGNLTFGKGDGVTANRDEARFLTGSPRIALLYSDLDPSSGGSVVYRNDDADTLTIEYSAVPLWGSSSGNTARVTLDASGTITLTIDGAPGTGYIVGVSAGGSGNGGIEQDLSTLASPIAYTDAGATYEVFSGSVDLVGKPLVFAP